MSLAEYIQEANPRLFELLTIDRFVDDIGNSEDNKETVLAIIDAADDLLDSYKNNVIKFGVEIKKIMRALGALTGA